MIQLIFCAFFSPTAAESINFLKQFPWIIETNSLRFNNLEYSFKNWSDIYGDESGNEMAINIDIKCRLRENYDKYLMLFTSNALPTNWLLNVCKKSSDRVEL